MRHVSKDKLLCLFGVASIIALLAAIAGLITSDWAYASSITIWQKVKWDWLPNLLLLSIYLLTSILAFMRSSMCVFFPILIVYPYGYEAITLIGNVTVNGLDYWMSYLGVITCLIYFTMALVLILRYLARFLGLV